MSQNHLSRDEDTVNTWPPFSVIPQGGGSTTGVHCCKKSAGRWTPGAKPPLRSAPRIGT